MGSKRIEQSIEELYEFIESCKPKGFSGTSVIVVKEQIYDLLDEMKLKIPDEINRCNKLLERRDEIIREAEARAQKIIEDAQFKAETMVKDSEIMRQAYLQANEYISRANQQAEETVATANYTADSIREGAFDYTRDMLGQIEAILQDSYNETKAKTDMLLEALFVNLEQVIANRKELDEQAAPGYDDEYTETDDNASEANYNYDSEENQEDGEDFNPNPDSFLRNIE